MDARVIQILAELVRESYPSASDPFDLPDGWSLAPLGLTTDANGFIHRGLGSEAFVATNGEMLVIVFQGTDDPLDIVVDATLPGLLFLLSQAFGDVIAAAKAYAAAHGLTLYTAGHSLGGALAEVVTVSDTSGQIAGGIGLGSPAPTLLDGGNDPSFVHITRTNDFFGMLGADEHTGVSVYIEDRAPLSIGEAHNHDRYADQITRIAESAATRGVDLAAGTRFLFLNSSVTNTLSGTELATYAGVFGGNLTDVLDASSASGTVRLEGGGGADTLIGGAASDSLAGGSGGDTLRGGGGADFLNGGANNDTMAGEAGGDRYSVGVGEGQDTIDDDGGVDGEDVLALFVGSLAASIDEDWLHVEGANLRVRIPNGTGGYAIDVLILNMGDPSGSIETLELIVGDNGEASDTLDLDRYWAQQHQLPEPDEPDAVDDVDDIDVPSASQFTWTGGSGSDIFTGTNGEDVVRGLGGADALGGGDDDDILLGNAGDDTINGGAGNDLLIDDDPGNWGIDTLDGGSGDDILVFYGVPEGDEDHGNGGSGDDLVLFDLSDNNDDWNLHEDDGVFTLRPDDTDDGGEVVVRNVETVAVIFGDGDDFAHGADEQNYFEGGGGDDQLSAEGGNDYLDGGAGDDRLDGGTGVDWIDGGSGNDRATVDLSNISQAVTYVADEATDEDGYTFVNGTHIRNIERIVLLTGSGNDRLWLGDDVDDVSTGGGADVITTEARGRDVVDGGSGVDRIIIDFSWSSTRVGSNTDGDFYVGTQITSSTNRVYTTNVEEFYVTGSSGNDLLRGMSGNDQLNGGAGNDDLFGNDGDDILRGGAGDDDISLGDGSDWADGGSGVDEGNFDDETGLSFNFDAFQAASSAGLTLADGTHVRNIEIWDLAFGSGNDTVRMPLLGDCQVMLGSGDNHLIIDESASGESFHAGLELWAGITWYMAYDGLSYDTAIDSIRANGADRVTIYGGSGADVIGGVDGADTLAGNGGDDALEGRLGDDALDGGAGFDRAVFGLTAAEATWSRDINGVWSINAGALGVDTLRNVEVLGFTDRNVVLDNAQQTFSGNGTSDFLWRNANHGTVVIWEMTGSTQQSATIAGGAPANWSIVATGDLNGDGKDDLIWQNSDDGGVAGWLMNGATPTSVAMISGAPAEWQVAGMGDFNFDGKDDFVWHNTETGAVAVWLMDGLTSTGQAIIYGAPLEWSVAAIADFDGDGHDDILLRNSNDGAMARWTTDGVTQTGAAIVGGAPLEWQVAGTGDFDGDGRADILLHNTTTGAASIWRMDGNTQFGAAIVGSAPTQWSVAQIGDFNGDGKDDIIWRHDDGTVALWVMDGFNVTSTSIIGAVPTDWELI